MSLEGVFPLTETADTAGGLFLIRRLKLFILIATSLFS